MLLPKGVERVRAHGRTYYYWNPGRGTDRQSERTALPNADDRPADFWREVERRISDVSTSFPVGSVGHLVESYHASEDFKSKSESTQSSYGVHLRRFSAPEAWGLLNVRDLTPRGVLAARDALKTTPGMANHMLSCGRTVWSWAIPLDMADNNPSERIKPFDVPDRGHVPWPRWVTDYVIAHGTPGLVRMTRLGIMTCQRESDLIRMGPEQRDRTGIWCRPKKTRRLRGAFFIPLQAADALELDHCAETPITFTNSRWKAPIQRRRDDLYLYSPRGAPYTETSIRARYHRRLNRTPEGKELGKPWQKYVADQVRKYEWDIDPDGAANPTIHGLRGTGILLR